MVWHFIGVYIIKRTLHDRLEKRNFSSRVEKYFTRSLRSLVKYFSTLGEKFRISARPCNILYFYSHSLHCQYFCCYFAFALLFCSKSAQELSLHCCVILAGALICVGVIIQAFKLIQFMATFSSVGVTVGLIQTPLHSCAEANYACLKFGRVSFFRRRRIRRVFFLHRSHKW